MINLAIITIGQSPRKDFKPLLNKYLSHANIIEYGVLDDYNPNFDYVEYERDTLFTTLHNGSQVEIGHSFAHSKVQEIIDKINKDNNVSIILIACTGDFSNIKSNLPVCSPDIFMGNLMNVILKDERVTVCIPSISQKEYIISKWKKHNFNIDIVPLSPYIRNEKDLDNVMLEIKEFENQYVITDCIGYDLTIKKQIEDSTQSQVYLPQELVFSVIGSYL